MSKRIIIAEDSSVILNLTKKILSQLQHEISTVKNGVEVLEELKKGPCDLVLLDIHMPIMDGMECAREIRSSKNEVPIVAITGNANNYSMDDFKEAGINDFLPKPLNYDHMLEMVKNYLGDAG